MRKRLISGLLCFVMTLTNIMPITPVYAAEGSTDNTQKTQADATNGTLVEYTVTESDWAWSIPSNFQFDSAHLQKNGTVKVFPLKNGVEDPNGSLLLPDRTIITISLSSRNYTAGDSFFQLKNTDDSTVKYYVSDTQNDVLAHRIEQNAVLINHKAGTNDPLSKDLWFTTTENDIKGVKLAGNHTDTLTFTLNATRADKDTYEILEGANQYYMGEGTAYLRSSGPYEEFQNVVIDNEVVDTSNYTTGEGSTKVWLSEEYLSTLSVGTHRISVVSEGGTASTNITVWRNGEVTFEGQDIYYYPTEGSSVEAIKNGNPKMYDSVIYGDYLYTYMDNDSIWEFLYSTNDVLMVLIFAELIGFEQYDTSNDIYIFNDGWVCSAAGIDPMSIKEGSQQEGLALMTNVVIDNTRESYGEIASYIHNIPVVSLFSTFSGSGISGKYDYDNLISSPTIPNTIKTMNQTYSGSGITVFPVIPNSVNVLRFTFGENSYTKSSCRNLAGGVFIINSNELLVTASVFSGITEGTITIAGTAPAEVKQILLENASYNDVKISETSELLFGVIPTTTFAATPLSQVCALANNAYGNDIENGFTMSVDEKNKDKTFNDIVNELYQYCIDNGIKVKNGTDVEPQDVTLNDIQTMLGVFIEIMSDSTSTYSVELDGLDYESAIEEVLGISGLGEILEFSTALPATDHQLRIVPLNFTLSLSANPFNITVEQFGPLMMDMLEEGGFNCSIDVSTDDKHCGYTLKELCDEMYYYCKENNIRITEVDGNGDVSGDVAVSKYHALILLCESLFGPIESPDVVEELNQMFTDAGLANMMSITCEDRSVDSTIGYTYSLEIPALELFIATTVQATIQA